MDFDRYSQTVHEYHVQAIRRIMNERRERLLSLRTRADAEAYVLRARRAARRCLLRHCPSKRCDLAARVTGRHAFDRFVVETVIFQSRPGIWVTGALFMPRHLDGPAPVVLGVCNHALNGKMCEVGTAFAQSLAAKGFLCLVTDPIGQGERREFEQTPDANSTDACLTHNRIGNAMSLVDDFIGSWMIWEGIRALDYLTSRPEADPTRVGVTGDAAGGMMTTFLAAVDRRVTMVAPSGYVSSIQMAFENEVPADSEQNPPGMLAAGLDQVDLLLAHAPRPTLILTQKYDNFDSRFALRAFQELRTVHRLLGSRTSFDFFCGPGLHGYTVHSRERMYSFFLRHAGLRGHAQEGARTAVPEQALQALTGEATRGLYRRPVSELVGEIAVACAKRRVPPTGSRLQAHAKRVLRVRTERAPPDYRVICPTHLQQQSAIRMQGQYLAETEPGILTVLTSCGGPVHPPQRLPEGHLVAYVGHLCAEDDLLNAPEVRPLLDKHTVVAIDPRGIGRSRAPTRNFRDFLHPYGIDFMYASAGEMLDRPYVGRRVYDVLRALDLLYASGASEIELVGRGLGSVTAAFAGLLHPRKPRIRLIHYLPSYDRIARSPRHSWPLSTLPRGILKFFDLPDVYHAVGSRLTLECPWDENMRLPREDADS